MSNEFSTLRLKSETLEKRLGTKDYEIKELIF